MVNNSIGKLIYSPICHISYTFIGIYPKNEFSAQDCDFPG
jgi:hypothetical protein